MPTYRSYQLQRRTACAGAALLLLAACLAPGTLGAHGGEDHSPQVQAAAAPSADANLLVTGAQNEQFELLAKYPIPDEDGTAHVRLYLADYATNRPLEGATFSFSFKPPGGAMNGSPRMISPGVYDATVRMHPDSVYNAVVTVTVGERTDFLELRNLYGHRRAEVFLEGQHKAAEPKAGESGPATSTLVIAGSALALLFGGGYLIARRALRARAAAGASAGPGPHDASGTAHGTNRMEE